MEPFENDIRHSFLYLFEDWGFEFDNVEDDYSGNIAVAQSGTLRIGFARDRADFFLDFSKVDEPDMSVGFYEIKVRLRTEGHLKTGFECSNKMSHVSRFLE